jgi:hypothetical protein
VGSGQWASGHLISEWAVDSGQWAVGAQVWGTTTAAAAKTSIQRAWRLTQLTLLNSTTNKCSVDAGFDGGDCCTRCKLSNSKGMDILKIFVKNDMF